MGKQIYFTDEECLMLRTFISAHDMTGIFSSDDEQKDRAIFDSIKKKLI